MKKTLLFTVLAFSIAAFFLFDLQDIFTLTFLKTEISQFRQWQQASPVWMISVFFIIYVVITLMTLAAGALFGLVNGTVISSFASTIGATLAFLTSRYLFREQVQSRFQDRLQTFNDGIRKEGRFYLFSLRLIPVFPFFLINLLAGLTPLGIAEFYWVSQIGMLAGTIVYVNAGTALAEITSLGDIFSPDLLISFTLLGIFPLVAKKLVTHYRKHRRLAQWQQPDHFDRNLIVIGGGAAGLVSAYIAATVRAKVTIIEANKMGGDCLNTGCVPSKALIRAASVAHQIRKAQQLGITTTAPQIRFRDVMQRIQHVIQQITPHDSAARYSALGAEVIHGRAHFIDPWTVEITHDDGHTQQLTGRNIILATGASPFVPPLPGLNDVGYLTSETLWQTLSEREEPPRRLLILGGGPIGCELAQCFARLGSEVTQIEMGERLLIREDLEISEIAEQALLSDGVTILTRHKALRCEFHEGEKRLLVSQDGAEKTLVFDDLICAVGRAPRLKGFGLETLGIDTGQRLETNAYLETVMPHIYACGDVIGPYQFTHTAAHQAWYATVNALFGQFKKFQVDYRVIPWSTFLAPEIARVGLNEQDAQAKHIAYEVTRFSLQELDRAIADGTTNGVVKVLTKPGSDQILGVTIVAEHAADLLSEFTLAMKYRLGLNKILSTIHVYPTLSEANKYVAGEWKRKHAPERLLVWLGHYHRWRRNH